MDLPQINFERQILESWSEKCQRLSTGVLDLQILLKNISPLLNEPTFVFATTSRDVAKKYEEYAKMVFYESEGVTLIIPKEHARIGYQFLFI